MRRLSALAAGVGVSVFVAGIFCVSPAQGATERKMVVPPRRAVFCDVDTVTVDTVKRLLKTFPTGTPLVVETFDGDEAQAFFKVFDTVFPALSISPAEAVAVFSAQGTSVLFFLRQGCLVGDHSLSFFTYEGIKAAMRSRGNPVP